MRKQKDSNQKVYDLDHLKRQDLTGLPCMQAFNIKGMSKGQKRRHFDRFGVAAEKPRGHDWVDIVSHLSKK